jgi:branched-chain amino acid transport system permease protein
MTALAGGLYCQYQMFISPDTVSGIAISLQMAFAVVVGGIYVSLGPTVGAVITILLAEALRISFGTGAVGWDNLVYGILLVLFIIFLPKGIVGSLLDAARPRASATLRRPHPVSAGWRGAPRAPPPPPRL